jgi:hypothetical protein
LGTDIEAPSFPDLRQEIFAEEANMADELGEVNDPTKPDENTITELKEEELKSVSGGLTNATISLTNATISRDI